MNYRNSLNNWLRSQASEISTYKRKSIEVHYPRQFWIIENRLATRSLNVVARHIMNGERIEIVNEEY